MRWFEFGLRGRRQSGEMAPARVPVTAAREEREAAVQEVVKALRAKRWDTDGREPFKGFGSHPGRF